MCCRFSRVKNNIYNLVSKMMPKRLKTTETSETDVSIKQRNGLNRPTCESLSHFTSPTKSQSDVKEYSVIKLQNGLTALLISDKSNIIDIDELNQISDSECSESDSESSVEYDSMESEVRDDSQKTSAGVEEKLAACALCIGVGSFSDPEDIPGLAHFLEHMIFMGSEKYPKENEFDNFIKKKGGSDNASTECEYTTFYFDCHEAHLLSAMEIFSELFISPLMKRETMTKEREAIESEFQMSLPSDESRKSQLLCSLAENDNPAHKFMWGNLITLRDRVKDDDLYEAVHEFRRRHYSAHRMTLAVQARLPIETLQKWVQDCFHNVPNNGLPPDEFSLVSRPFKEHEFCKLYLIEPVKNINHLDLTWVMPSTLKLYKTKPLNYMSWIIGHEGKGSLLSFLRKKLWCFDITVSSGSDGTEENAIYSLFSITLVLSKEGILHIDEILVLVFEYIKMFQNAGPQERLFDEMKLVADIAFKFSEEVPSSDNVEQLSESMHFYPSQYYITGSELFFEYNPELISKFLNELRADNVNIMVSSKETTSNEILDKVEPWFGTRYQAKDIPPEWIKKWHEVNITEIFHLPESNPFIASNFTILPTPSDLDQFPKNIVKNDVLELWFKQDVTFKLPYAFCCLHLISPLSHKSAKNAAMLDLFITLLKQSLNEELYPANIAHLEHGFHPGEKGIVITVNGFNEKLKIFLEAILKGTIFLTENMDQDMFSSMKDELKRGYSNNCLKTGFLARDIRMSILLKTFWTALEKEQALEDVSFETMKEFVTEYFKHLYIQCLIQGNLSKEEAISICELVKDELSCKPLNLAKPEIQVNQLPSGEKYCVVHSFNAEDANSVVTNYYQSGLGTIHESCIIELLLMLMDEPIFDSLRTKQQLGYDVSCSLRDTFGILGFSVSVHCQSDRNSVEVVESRITEFLKDFLETLKDTSLDEFKEVQESLVKLKKCADIHLKEEVKRNWDEIKNEEYVFDRQQKEIQYIEKLTLEDVIKWFELTTGTLLPVTTNFKKLSMQVVGKTGCRNVIDSKIPCEDGYNVQQKELCFLQLQEPCDKFISNITDFKQTLSVYPVHKIM